MCNISSSKCNQEIIFCQLTEYNIRNIFLRKLYPKHGGKAIPRCPAPGAFSIQRQFVGTKSPLKMMKNAFDEKIHLKNSFRIQNKVEKLFPYLFLKDKNSAYLLINSLIWYSFFSSHGFWRKVFLLLYFINWTNFIFWFSVLQEILSNMCIVINQVVSW